MNRVSIRFLSNPLAYCSVLLLCGCTHPVPVPDLDTRAKSFPTVAAEYRTSVEPVSRSSHGESTTVWRLWRGADRIVVENLAAHTGEIWQRDGANMFHQKLFHDDRKSIEFQMDDLRMQRVALAWEQRALLIDPQLLSQLQLKRSGWRGGYPYHRYVGTVDGHHWDVTIRTDLSLPVRLVRSGPDTRERTELVGSFALQTAPFAPTSTEGYEIIDYTDFGDRQQDPFVAKVQSLLGQPHRH